MWALGGNPERYVVVGVSGFGTDRDGKGQPSGAHDNLPVDRVHITETVLLTYHADKQELHSVLTRFQCDRGMQGESDLGLMIMANSWGAGKAVKLAKLYSETCGRSADLFVMVDGVAQPLSSWKKAPIAKRCVNYYQRRSTVHGGAIEGCINHDVSSVCGRDAGVATCHIIIEWDATTRGASLMKRLLAGEDLLED